MIEYRLADQKDIPLLVEIRKKQLIDEGADPAEVIDKELTDYFHKKMNDKTLIQWMAKDNDEIVATGAIIFMEFPPGFTNKSGQKGYIANMYTAPNYRRQGLASKILTLLEEEARKRNITRLCLGASQMGQPVYAKYGFEKTEVWMEMSLEDIK